MKRIKQDEDKKDKYKTVMTWLREGKVQNDMEFRHYCEDNLFLILPRKDSVQMIEKEILNLSERINSERKNLKTYVGRLRMIIERANGDLNVDDLEEGVRNLVIEEEESEY